LGAEKIREILTPAKQNTIHENPNLTGSLDQFEESIRNIFNDFTDYGYTEIIKQLHLAGWTPITSAVAEDISATPGPLYVERFGPINYDGEKNGNYFTVLNNESLSYTLVQMIDEVPKSVEPEVLFRDIPDFQTLRDLDKCKEIIACFYYPTREEAGDFFGPLTKEYFLLIRKPLQLGLWNGNLHGRQMVNNPEADIFNWPVITPGEFDESPMQPMYSFWRPVFGVPMIRIGGRSTKNDQDPITIEDKALMVFKIWTSLIVNNGSPGGDGGGERTGGGSQPEDALIAPYFERYGRNWQRLETESGYGGTLDMVPANDPMASVFYKFTIGLGGSYTVVAHVPRTEQPPAAARYAAYIVDNLDDLAGETALGEPVWTNTVDLTESEAYNTGMDEEGFIEIGTIRVDVTVPELATVVIRLSAGESSDRYLLADAVKLVPEEWLE